jgi:hypothetical protein
VINEMIIIAVITIALIAYASRRASGRQRSRASFGPEYARVKAEDGGTRAADRELNPGTRMHDKLPPEPLSAYDRDFYAMSWEHVRRGFLDDPAVALGAAEQLIARLLAARGYPADEQREQLALLPVQYGGTLGGYRQAQSVSERMRIDTTRVTMEQKRTALTQYQVFFGDLLTVPGAAAPRRIQESGARP